MLEQTAINALRAAAVPEQVHFIGGKNTPPLEGGMLDVFSPIDGKRLTAIANGAAADVDAACAAARAAFEDRRWAGLPPAQRKKVLHRLAGLIERDALEITVLGVRDNGAEINMAINAEAYSAAATFRYYAEATDKICGDIAPTAPNILALIHREPVGVVGAIVPWNFPLMVGSWKIAPALAAGNSLVLKPSESASLSLLKIAELAAEAGVPDGVFNVVTGEGKTAGEALALSMEVDVLAFTGGGGTGRKLLEYSARSNMKRCYLELGGKSPNIIFNDAPNLEQAAAVSAMGIFRDSGQTCVAPSRLLVQRDICDEFTAALCECAKKLKVGDPLELASDIGAVHSLAALESNLRFVKTAEDEGAVRLLGGGRILEDSGGYYMQPTVMAGVKPGDTLAQREVFGPVLAVTAFEDEAEAARLANNTRYGLAAGVWTADISRAHRMVGAIRAGVVHVNTYGGADITAPMGGRKESGNGVDKSMHALDKYLDLKTAWIQL